MYTTGRHNRKARVSIKRIVLNILMVSKGLKSFIKEDSGCKYNQILTLQVILLNSGYIIDPSFKNLIFTNKKTGIK
jgi:hypothetical protein